MNYRNVRHLLSLGALLSAVTALAPVAVAEEEVMEEVVVTGDLNSLPGEDVKSIFGFNKSILETPRSVSTVSEELMDRMKCRTLTSSLPFPWLLYPIVLRRGRRP